MRLADATDADSNVGPNSYGLGGMNSTLVAAHRPQRTEIRFRRFFAPVRHNRYLDFQRQ
jgi:hypothetical protein